MTTKMTFQVISRQHGPIPDGFKFRSLWKVQTQDQALSLCVRIQVKSAAVETRAIGAVMVKNRWRRLVERSPIAPSALAKLRLTDKMTKQIKDLYAVELEILSEGLVALGLSESIPDAKRELREYLQTRKVDHKK